MTPEAKKRFQAHLRRHLKIVRWPFIASMLILAVTSILTAGKAFLIKPVGDVIETQRENVTHSDLWKFCLVVVGIFGFQAVLNYFYMVVGRVASAALVRNVRAELFGHLMRQSMGYFGTRPSADLTSRVVNDVAIFETAAVNSIQSIVRDVLTVLALLAVMMAFAWKLALICIGIILVVALVLRVMSRAVSSLSLTAQQMLGSVAKQLHEMIGGIELVLSFGLGRLWRSRFDDVNQQHYDTMMRSQKVSAMSVMIVLLIVSAGIGGLLMITGSALIDRTVSFGDFSLVLAALYLMQAPAMGIGPAVAGLSRGFAAGARALELLDEIPDLEDPEAPDSFRTAEGRVEFKDVHFHYGQEPVLRGLSFAVEPGELVVMVGDSGAGKSTVAKLLQRFYDVDSGSVWIDGARVDRVKRSDLCRAVSYVAQDVFLFDNTLEFNLKVGKQDADEAEIWEALRIAELEPMIRDLPEGLQTVVGERGVRLSGGQRQRIAIARAVLSDARVLVMDEATSALDMDLERRILQNLVDLGSRRTIFAITHRLSMAEIADRVVVLKQGTLAEQGPAVDLVGRDGEFARLQKASQAKLVRSDRVPAKEGPAS